ncbi:MAG: hypothetical protein CMJ78_05770 [Planctomycetaceae bacterium]|nr:hypothetical protein [Planctomycetaceae bacterium]
MLDDLTFPKGNIEHASTDSKFTLAASDNCTHAKIFTTSPAPFIQRGIVGTPRFAIRRASGDSIFYSAVHLRSLCIRSSIFSSTTSSLALLFDLNRRVSCRRTLFRRASAPSRETAVCVVRHQSLIVDDNR